MPAGSWDNLYKPHAPGAIMVETNLAFAGTHTGKGFLFLGDDAKWASFLVLFLLIFVSVRHSNPAAVRRFSKRIAAVQKAGSKKGWLDCAWSSLMRGTAFVGPFIWLALQILLLIFTFKLNASGIFEGTTQHTRLVTAGNTTQSLELNMDAHRVQLTKVNYNFFRLFQMLALVCMNIWMYAFFDLESFLFAIGVAAIMFVAQVCVLISITFYPTYINTTTGALHRDWRTDGDAVGAFIVWMIFTVYSAIMGLFVPFLVWKSINFDLVAERTRRMLGLPEEPAEKDGSDELLLGQQRAQPTARAAAPINRAVAHVEMGYPVAGSDMAYSVPGAITRF